MADSNDFKIKVSVDAADAVSGLDKINEGLSGVAAGTEGAGEGANKASKGIERMVEEAGTIRESQRVAMGFFDTFEGGGRAVEGAAELMRFFLTTAVELDPPLATLLILMASVTTVFMRHGEEAKKTAVAAGKAADDEKGAIRDLEQQAKESYPNMLAMLQAQTAEMLKQVAAQKDLQRAKDELENAEMAGKIATLDDQEQTDLAGKSEGDQAVIKRDYERKRIALRQQDATDKAKQELKEKQDAAKAAEDAIAEKRNEAAAEGQKLTQAYGVVQGGAAAGLNQAEVKSDAQIADERMKALEEKGNSVDITGDTVGLSNEERIEYENLQRSLPQLQQKEAANGPDFTGQTAVLTKAKADAEAEEKKDLDPSIAEKIEDPALLLHNQQMATDARARADKAAAQLKAIDDYTAQMKAAQDVLADGVPKFKSLNNEVPALQTKLEAAGDDVKAAQQKVSNLQTVQHTESTKLTAQQAREIAKEDFDKREAQRKVASDTIQTELGNPNLDVTGRERLQQQIEDNRKAGDKDKLDNAVPLGLTPPEIIALRGNGPITQKATNYKIQTEQKKAEQEQQRLLDSHTKTDERSTGAEAIGEIQSLGGSRQQVEAARTAVQQMDKGNDAGAQQLAGILSQLTGTVKNLTDGQSATIGKVFQHLKDIDQELKDHLARMNQIANHG